MQFEQPKHNNEYTERNRKMNNEKYLQILKDYVEEFNRNDEEVYKQSIDNAHAFEWLADNIPLLDCPDKDISLTYYFRWWVFRKHQRSSPAGPLFTEFLPDVGWAGAYNTINCASCFHIREGRWLRNIGSAIMNYIDFWFRGEGNEHSYSTWLEYAAWEYAVLTQNFEQFRSYFPDFEKDYAWWEENHFTPELGLFWSIDDRDAMEYMISGSGYRPTLNSYMYGNATAIANFAAKFGFNDKEKLYRKKAEDIRKAMYERLKDTDGYFKVLPAETDDLKWIFRNCKYSHISEVPEDHRVKEEIDFVPWYFDLPLNGDGGCFRDLTNPDIFYGEYGLRTADGSHPRYNYKVAHECLWNGPSWPFATTQTLAACANLLDDYAPEENGFTKEDYYKIFRQYALQHRLVRDDGKTVPWVDEDLDADTGVWIARKILIEQGSVIYERGKDYNHSMFCDLLITGLLGIKVSENGEIAVKPKVPDTWNYWIITHLPIGGKLYTVQYDRDGNTYGRGAGISVIEEK